MGHFVTVATCALNQWALDFAGNLARVTDSIRRAKAANATLRIGAELELTGYSCQDHFLEGDTVLHAWESLEHVLRVSHSAARGMLIDTGMPVVHRGACYNCRVVVLDGRILLIRPKMHLANDGNYREPRWFTAWTQPRTVEQHVLPRRIVRVMAELHPELAAQTDQRSGMSPLHTVAFGDGVVAARDAVVGVELCEELFAPQSPHIAMSLDGVDIFTNSSGSHHELRKLHRRVELMREATAKCGGAYLYANQRGCDGDRLYFDGCAMVAVNGDVVAQGSQFGLADVEVVVATFDIEDVRSYRAAVASRGVQAASSPSYPRVFADVALTEPATAARAAGRAPTQPLATVRYHTTAEEIALGPACWLWDYLRRAKLGGFFLPLSGGIDSCASALIVASMCQLAVAAAHNDRDPAAQQQVLADIRRIVSIHAPDTAADYVPSSAHELAGYILHTCYMGTEHSSRETRSRAADLAACIGSYHTSLVMDTVIAAIVALFVAVTGSTPRFTAHGGSSSENLALQNIQARLRMLLAYLLAQLLLWVRTGGRSGASLLVLGSANVDESLRGYFTKYDCSSADLNPIGGISKTDLRAFVAHAAATFPSAPGSDGAATYSAVLRRFLDATPTAELVPSTADYVQSDEAEMGMSYAELAEFGRLRKVHRCGPYSMFAKLLDRWQPSVDHGGRGLSPAEIAAKVKRFFFFHAINRHKMTTLTPSYHAEAYSPDDNRFDLRPFLYDASWQRQFEDIDADVAAMASAAASNCSSTSPSSAS